MAAIASQAVVHCPTGDPRPRIRRPLQPLPLENLVVSYPHNLPIPSVALWDNARKGDNTLTCIAPVVYLYPISWRHVKGKLRQMGKGAHRITRHGPQVGADLLSANRLSAASVDSNGTYLISRISSKYIVPAPPAAGLPLMPKPMVMLSTFVRSTPKADRSIVHSAHSSVCVTAGPS